MSEVGSGKATFWSADAGDDANTYIMLTIEAVELNTHTADKLSRLLYPPYIIPSMITKAVKTCGEEDPLELELNTPIPKDFLQKVLVETWKGSSFNTSLLSSTDLAFIDALELMLRKKGNLDTKAEAAWKPGHDQRKALVVYHKQRDDRGHIHVILDLEKMEVDNDKYIQNMIQAAKAIGLMVTIYQILDLTKVLAYYRLSEFTWLGTSSQHLLDCYRQQGLCMVPATTSGDDDEKSLSTSPSL